MENDLFSDWDNETNKSQGNTRIRVQVNPTIINSDRQNQAQAEVQVQLQRQFQAQLEAQRERQVQFEAQVQAQLQRIFDLLED